ncbi:MAG: response regulator transcription factor [Azonexus sp.]|nr:response regulator transcription factor [Azonexus sp.]MCK6413117.1 response regulator transcription factor [Azonexus sp.]
MSAVLLIDDDIALTALLADYLTREGYAVSTVNDPVEGISAALSGQFAIAVLDVMMPGVSGIEVLRQIRAAGNLPVLMLTARGDDMDRIVGLELGADDYVPKPCPPRELAARLRAILRRTAAPPESQGLPIVIGALCVRPGQRVVEWAGERVTLTSSEFNLVLALARQPGVPVSKEVLSLEGLGRPLARFDRSVDVHLSSIRQKLGTLADGRSCIQTVYRRGYQLIRD